ncbi:xanthine dehydrogenase family protein molybdopterin-binding subunit [Castellaniella sp. GW247-6E4]|uniref:xanthine dehydrogenase family protein molybdopterin-binding subunit n=1 Tax=Castellaniella sp. GW247-6E4 TaxID=3140380 RepID=UPI003314E578
MNYQGMPGWLRSACSGRVFTEDVYPDGCLHAAFVRSPHAHASIIDIHTRIEGMEGVVAVWTAADLPGQPRPIPCIIPLKNRDGTARADPPRTLLARGKVRHHGEAVAMVVARTARMAEAAARRIDVVYEPLPQVTQADLALQPGAPRVWDDIPGNLCFDWETGDEAAVEAAMRTAASVVEASIVNNRVVPSPLETRSAVAWVDPDTGERILITPSQGAHWTRDVIARDVLGWDPATLEVITPRVGGSFGMKIFVYPEQVLVLLAAQHLGQAVKWVASRTEAFLSDTHGRDHHTRVRLALDADGNFLAIRADTDANLGASLSNYGPFNPTMCSSPVLPGAYRFGAMYSRVRGALTHTVPLDSYRGAGRPEANYVLERIIDIAALELNLDRAALRRRNLLRPADLPYTTSTGVRLTGGLFADNLERALEKIDYAGFPARRDKSRAGNKLRGLGLANYLETNGGMALARVTQPDGVSRESARLCFRRDGRLRADVGTQSSGQGHRTSYTKILADYLGYDASAITVHQGRTDRLAQGMGTGGSKSLLSGSTALLQAADAVILKAREWAAKVWGVPLEQVRWEAGRLSCGARHFTLHELAILAVADLPEGTPHPFETEVCAAITEGTFANGCHACEVEIDPDTGAVDILNYVSVNDFGVIISDDKVRNQVVGGSAQGIGQALLEDCRFDPDDGRLMTADFGRYHLPQVADMPPMEVVLNQGSAGANRLGIKGCGESGASAAPPAVMNAVQDALSSALGRQASTIQMPATPPAIWALLHAKESRA